MEKGDWAFLAVLLAAFAGYLWANRDKCVLCDGSIWALPKKMEEVPNGG